MSSELCRLCKHSPHLSDNFDAVLKPFNLDKYVEFYEQHIEQLKALISEKDQIIERLVKQSEGK